MKVAVTGAFGYSGRYIARRLLQAGHQVITLTNTIPAGDPFNGAVRAFPFYFDQPEKLTAVLRDIDALINNYWVRFDHRSFTHTQAVANSRILFRAAKSAGIKRIVHVSITNPDPNSDLAYFRGKAALEEAVVETGIPYCILRPTVLFGKEDVLINNIAWALRHLPMFGVFGSGTYRLQPIYVDDLAGLAAEKVTKATSETLDAIGPETFEYYEFVRTIRDALGLNRPILRIPPRLGYWCCRYLGLLLGDIVITREEIQGLMQERLYVNSPALAQTRFSQWLLENRQLLGRTYTSELARRRPNKNAAA